MEALGINPSFILVTAVAFLLLFFVLKKFAFGPIFNMLEARQSNIRQNLDEAASRRDEMARLQGEYETRLAQIEDEARDKIQAAIRDAQAARDEILAKAQADSAAIVARGNQELAGERAKAMEEMRNQIADLSAQMAGRIVKSNLDSAGHAQMINEVIGGIAAANGSAASGSAL